MGSHGQSHHGLTSAFIVKSNQVGWKSVTLPSVFWLSTLAIVLSSGSVHLALRFFREREMARYRLWMGITLALGILFVGLQWNGFTALWAQQITFRGSGAGQFLYVIFGLHALHVVGGVVVLSVLLAKAFFGRIKLYSSIPVEIAATYWHFVDLLWIYLLLFFLLIGGN